MSQLFKLEIFVLKMCITISISIIIKLYIWNFLNSATLLNNTDSIVAIHYKKGSPRHGQFASGLIGHP